MWLKIKRVGAIASGMLLVVASLALVPLLLLAVCRMPE